MHTDTVAHADEMVTDTPVGAIAFVPTRGGSLLPAASATRAMQRSWSTSHTSSWCSKGELELGTVNMLCNTQMLSIIEMLQNTRPDQWTGPQCRGSMAAAPAGAIRDLSQSQLGPVREQVLWLQVGVLHCHSSTSHVTSLRSSPDTCVRAAELVSNDSHIHCVFPAAWHASKLNFHIQ